jgi:hypothetical protein
VLCSRVTQSILLPPWRPRIASFEATATAAPAVEATEAVTTKTVAAATMMKVKTLLS